MRNTRFVFVEGLMGAGPPSRPVPSWRVTSLYTPTIWNRSAQALPLAAQIEASMTALTRSFCCAIRRRSPYDLPAAHAADAVSAMCGPVTHLG